MAKNNVSISLPILALFNETLKSSIYTLKRINDKIPPSLTPLEMLKDGEWAYTGNFNNLYIESHSHFAPVFSPKTRHEITHYNLTAKFLNAEYRGLGVETDYVHFS